MKQINILSIDFDYFQNVPVNVLACNYPDGHDYEEILSNIVWVSIYGHPYISQQILDVTIKDDKLNELINYIKRIKRKIPVCIADSHVKIYNFIKENYQADSELNIINIDMHHDVFDVHPENIHCGNWLKIIMKEYQTDATWICNPTSLELLYTPDNITTIVDDLSGLNDINFDMIFLCKSIEYIPPHLDKYFIKLAKALSKIAKPLKCENIVHTRYNKAFKQMVKQTQSEMQKIINELNN